MLYHELINIAWGYIPANSWNLFIVLKNHHLSTKRRKPIASFSKSTDSLEILSSTLVFSSNCKIHRFQVKCIFHSPAVTEYFAKFEHHLDSCMLYKTEIGCF